MAKAPLVASPRDGGSGSPSSSANRPATPHAHHRMRSSSLHRRSHVVMSEVEELFADVDTAVHALRCTAKLWPSSTTPTPPSSSPPPPPSGAAPVDPLQAAHLAGQSLRHQDPTTEAARGHRNIDSASQRSHSRLRCSRQRHQMAPLQSPTLDDSDEESLGGYSSLFKDIAVVPVNLSRAAELDAGDVYILLVVQRPALNGVAASSLSGPPTGSSLPAAEKAEWSADMLHTFTPRGLAAAFSSDVTRPSMWGSSSTAGPSPFATPRTNGSTSGTPSPSGGLSSTNLHLFTTPRSTSSYPTPREGEHHYSIHLLTGRDAAQLTAAAAVFVARSVERLCIEHPGFIRRLFFNYNTTLVAMALEAPIANGATAPSPSAAFKRREVGDAESVRSLYSPNAKLEVPFDLRAEMLAAMAPKKVVAPSFKAARSFSTPPPATGSSLRMLSPRELYASNAIARVLNGVRASTPYRLVGSDGLNFSISTQLSNNAGGCSGPGSAVRRGGANAWQLDSLTPHRPRRVASYATDLSPSSAAAPTPPPPPPLQRLNILQGPEPLEINHALSVGRLMPPSDSAAATCTPGAATSTTTTVGRARTPRLRIPTLPLDGQPVGNDAAGAEPRRVAPNSTLPDATRSTPVMPRLSLEGVDGWKRLGPVQPHGMSLPLSSLRATADDPLPWATSPARPLPSPHPFAALRLPEHGPHPPTAACPKEAEEEDYNEVHDERDRVRRLKAALPDATEVLPYLFVGGEDAARDRQQLLQKGITHVINTVHGELDNFFPDIFRYMSLSLSDSLDEPIFLLLPSVVQFIEDARRDTAGGEGRVFIHCRQGVSRSCTLVIAYIMWKVGLSYDAAYEMVRAKRNVCNPNLGFGMALRRWEAQLSRPLLSAAFAYAPYSLFSPVPFVFQPTHFFSAFGATASPLRMSSSSFPSSTAPIPYSTISATKAEEEEQVEYMRSICPRATYVDSKSTEVFLDHRLCYAFLFGPSLPSSPSATSSPALSSFLVLPEPSHEVHPVHPEQVLRHWRQFLNCGFYSGPPQESRTSDGTIITFRPLPPIQIDAAPYLYPQMAVPMLQRLLAPRMASLPAGPRVHLHAAPCWTPLLAVEEIGLRLQSYEVKEKHLALTEATRQHARAAGQLRSLSAPDGSIGRRAGHTPRQRRYSSHSMNESSASLRAGPGAEAAGAALTALQRPCNASAPAHTLLGMPGAGDRPAAAGGAAAAPLPFKSGTAPAVVFPPLFTPNAAMAPAPIIPGHAAGDNFGFKYPFTAAARCAVDDAEDLNPEECFAIGFLLPRGAMVYLWCGHAATVSPAAVVDAFVREMVLAAEPGLSEALRSGAPVFCDVKLPTGDGVRGAAVPTGLPFSSSQPHQRQHQNGSLGGFQIGSDAEICMTHAGLPGPPPSRSATTFSAQVILIKDGQEPKEFWSFF